MKKLFILNILLMLIFFASSCRKELTDLPVESNTISNNSHWEKMIKGLDSNRSLSDSDWEYLQNRIVGNTINYEAGCDSVWLPTLLGSGGTLIFYPDYLEVDMGTYWFYYPPRDIPALIVFHVKWQQNGRQRAKTIFTVTRKLRDPYDIGSTYMNDLQIDYNTQFTADTWAFTVCQTNHIFSVFGPYPSPYERLSQPGQRLQFGNSIPGLK